MTEYILDAGGVQDVSVILVYRLPVGIRSERFVIHGTCRRNKKCSSFVIWAVVRRCADVVVVPLRLNLVQATRSERSITVSATGVGIV